MRPVCPPFSARKEYDWPCFSEFGISGAPFFVVEVYLSLKLLYFVAIIFNKYRVIFWAFRIDGNFERKVYEWVHIFRAHVYLYEWDVPHIHTKISTKLPSPHKSDHDLYDHSKKR